MSWATVAGLLIIATICAIASRVWWSACVMRRREYLEAKIKEIESDLDKAILEDQDNTANHVRLRAQLVRLRRERDGLCI